MQIADNAAGLYMSDLILNLNEPNALGDVSWVNPFKYVGIWWSMHLGTETWASGPRHGATTANAKRYIDFAAENGFRGVLVEGWNKGWDGDWFADGSAFSFTEPYPDFDLAAVAAYARERGVRLDRPSRNVRVSSRTTRISWKRRWICTRDSASTRSRPATSRTRAASRPRGATASIRYEWHDGQVMSRHHLKVVTEAAKRHITVDAHEPIKDTGLRRTYPNWVRARAHAAWNTTPGAIRQTRPNTRPISCSRACWLARWTSRPAC